METDTEKELLLEIHRKLGNFTEELREEYPVHLVDKAEREHAEEVES